MTDYNAIRNPGSSLLRTAENQNQRKIHKCGPLIVLGFILCFSSNPTHGADTTAIAISPSSLVYPLLYGLEYGKVSLELKKTSKSSYLIQISGTHLRKQNTETYHLIFGGNDSVENDFERGQYAVFIGKRIFYHFAYLQPMLNLGYASYENYLAPKESYRSMFSSALVYCGLRFSNGYVIDFNVGGGYDLFGKRSWENGPINIDGNLAIGYEF